jgi:hypothetical protein
MSEDNEIQAVPESVSESDFNVIKQELERFKAKHAASEKHLKEQEKTAKLAAKDAALLAEESARKSGDVEALEESWRAKLDAATKDNSENLIKYQKTIADLTSGATAKALANKLALSGSADVLLPHIERRLKVEMQDGTPIVRVLDANGKPSAMSIEDLEKEISANKAFAPLLVGSNASGSGSIGDKSRGGARSLGRDEFNSKSPADKMAFMKEGGRVSN